MLCAITYDVVIPNDFRKKLNRIPLKLILFLCGAILLFGFDRSGFLPTIWIVVWAALFTTRLSIAVKRKVELKQLNKINQA